MKFLILLMYYERPWMVKNALQSLLDTTHNDWEVAFIDDGSTLAGKPVVDNFFKDRPDILAKFKFYNTNDSKAAKIERGAAIFGKVMNQAIKESNADIGIMLCDDDALFPTYLEGLNNFFTNHPEVVYAYSHVILFNPLDEGFEGAKHKTQASTETLYYTTPIDPCCRVDSSQVAWNLKCNKEGGIWFPYPQTSNLDATFYAALYAKYGNCVWTGLIGQFKGWFKNQLGKRLDPYKDTES